MNDPHIDELDFTVARHVSSMLCCALDWLTDDELHGVSRICAVAVRRPPAAEIARALDWGSRHQLARRLARSGLPKHGTLLNWIRILHWLVAAELRGSSLAAQALARLDDPASYYRVVQRTTGLPWRKVKARGSSWALVALLDRCNRHRRAEWIDPSARTTRSRA